MTSEEEGPVLRGKHVLIGLIGMFGVVIAVNVAFAYFAIDTFTGLTDQHPYLHGLAYNKVLEARHEISELGWHSELTIGKSKDGADSLTLTVEDKSGTPLHGLSLTGSLRRPTHAGMDQTLTWQEGKPGTYSAVATLPKRGNWELVATAEDHRHPPFVMKARLWFK